MKFQNQTSDLSAAHQTVTEALGVKNASPNGTAKLMADLGKTPTIADQQAAMMSELVERTRNWVGHDHDVSIEYVVRWSGTFRRFAETLYTCRIIGPGTQLHNGTAHVDPVEACRSAVNAWTLDRIKAQREAANAAENRAAAKIETSDFLTGEIFRDDGNATDVLPLTSNGPSGIGGEYQREVWP